MTWKKKNKKNSNNNSNKFNSKSEPLVKHSLNRFFDSTEIAQVKNVLKIKEINSVPVAVACVILNKIDVLEKGLKCGVNINETGPNHTKALTWAVKLKNLRIIKFLLLNQADVRSENGDHIVFNALEQKLWDEDSFLDLWPLFLTDVSFDLNASNKHGHTILHVAVRKEWEKFTKALLNANVNVNITNINGVTPLMTACCRNNLNIVNCLMNFGAELRIEDNHYRTALCYAIVSSSKISNQNSPLFVIVEKIIGDCKETSLLETYIKRRVEVVGLILNKTKFNKAEANTLLTVLQYTVQYIKDGLNIILETNIFQLFAKVLKENLQDEKKKFVLQLMQEMLYFQEDRPHVFERATQMKLTNDILKIDLITSCLDLIEHRKSYSNLALYIVMTFSTLNDMGHRWALENYEKFKRLFTWLPNDYLGENESDYPLEVLLKMIRKEVKEVRKISSSTPIATTREKKMTTLSKRWKSAKHISEPVFHIKKSRRKTKTKTKSKSAKSSLSDRSKGKRYLNSLLEDQNGQSEQQFAPEMNSLTDRIIILNSKKNDNMTESSYLPCSSHQLAKEIEEHERVIKTFMTDDLFCPISDENGTLDDSVSNPICTSLKQFLANQLQRDNKSINPRKYSYSLTSTSPRWKSYIETLPFNNFPTFSEEGVEIDTGKLRDAIQYMKKTSLNSVAVDPAAMDDAVAIIIDYFKTLLKIIINDSRNVYGHQEQTNKNENQLTSVDLQNVAELHANYRHLLASISSLAQYDVTEMLKNIFHLESVLLQFNLSSREPLMYRVCAEESIKIRYTLGPNEDNISFLSSYMEDVLNEVQAPRQDINIDVVETLLELGKELPGLFAKETNMLSRPKSRNRFKEVEGKIKTMQEAYHLMDSIENLLHDADDAMVNMTDVNGDSNWEYCEPSTNSRWKKKIDYLQVAKSFETLLGGNVKLCQYSERTHVISQGGNFNIVTLGLGINDQPLAVKRIPREHYVCNLLKSLIDPLLGLRNKHLLHYCVCDFDRNDLILATPLCEYNIGQYIVLMNEGNAKKNVFKLTNAEIVQQFLIGLAFLHQRSDPIVHGNLKPSNIFVNMQGVVRLAEFGINKALFKLIEPPKTSLIWFSQESYYTYKTTSKMQCSLYSDIQVAGMLIYFIISGGKHPFGPDVTAILKNLEQSTNIPIQEIDNDSSHEDQRFTDITSWMLRFRPSDRPRIKRILSHVSFWDNDRKWCFILNCAGVSTSGIPFAVSVTEMHNSLNEIAVKERINGRWMDVMRNKFPKFECHSEYESDTLAGFLRFIKRFYETHIFVDAMGVNELRNCILQSFPALASTLFRILESRRLLKKYPFVFYSI
ncbi:hypothetical protein ABEB36_011618 [Hypothenemus hampei]|uniref:Protein kinase domain-containing protein n=1 Tax=Hypothenemus hampei TaxID=57062 RepID=A0ABD1E8M7_HYPHA